MNKSEWNLYSQVYDIYYRDYLIDVDYLDRRWQEKWKSVLEVGCGSGRLLPFFEKKRVSNYFGFDVCPEMLSICLKRIRSENYFLCLGDFSQAGLHKGFDLFVYAFNTINYLLTPEQVVQHLRLCSTNLNEHGSIFIDALVPFAVSKGEDGSRYVRRESVKENGCSYELWDRRYYDPVLQIEERHMKSAMITDGEETSQLFFKTWRRYYSVEDIESYAREAGLRISLADPYFHAGYLDGYLVWLERDPDLAKRKQKKVGQKNMGG